MKNSSKSLFSRLAGFLTVSMATQVRASADLSHSMLTSLPTCFRFQIFFFNLLMWFSFALLSYICWLCHSSPSGHLLSAWPCIEEGSSFLAEGRHVIVICTSVSLVSHMYLSVLINSNGVSLLAECWTKRCRPLSSAAVSSPI